MRFLNRLHSFNRTNVELKYTRLIEMQQMDKVLIVLM